MNATLRKVLRLCAAAIGIFLVSPLSIPLFFGHVRIVILMTTLPLIDVLGVGLLTWAGGSLSWAAIAGAIANWWLVVNAGAAESGPYAILFVLLRYPIYLAAAVVGAKRERKRWVRWCGLILPGVVILYVLLVWGIYLLTGFIRAG